MTQNDPQTDLVAIAEQAAEAYNARDFDRFEQFFVEDLHFRHHNRGFGFDTRAELIDTLRVFATELIPDRRFGPATRITRHGNVVVREQPWGGTAKADVPGIAAAGETFTLDLCTVYVFDGDRVREYHDYG